MSPIAALLLRSSKIPNNAAIIIILAMSNHKSHDRNQKIMHEDMTQLFALSQSKNTN